MHRRRFDPAKSHKLEDPARESYLPIHNVLQLLDLRRKMNIADLGAGTGYFALPIAAKIEPGIVYAVDVSPEMLQKIRQKLAKPGAPRNLEMIEAAIETTGLADSSIDRAFCVNVWHELEDRMLAIREIARLLRPGGAFLLVDWRNDVERGEMGPPIEERLVSANVAAEMTAAGWEHVHAGNIGLASFYVRGIRPK